MESSAGFLCCFSQVVSVHTELEHTPSNLHQQAISRDSFHSGRTVDCRFRLCDIRVWHVIFLGVFLLGKKWAKIMLLWCLVTSYGFFNG